MQPPVDDTHLEILTEIRNWIRAAAHTPVKAVLETALPDAKTRAAYQMFDGKTAAEDVRIACKMSPNAVIALANRCAAMRLLETNADKKRRRLFDLADFGLLGSPNQGNK